MGWSGGAKVLCILHHWGVQLILAYSWARPAILVVGKGRGECFSVSSLSFLFLFLPCPSLSSPLLSLLSLFSLSLGDDTKWPSRVDVSLNPNTINVQFQKHKITTMNKWRIVPFYNAKEIHYCCFIWNFLFDLQKITESFDFNIYFHKI